MLDYLLIWIFPPRIAIATVVSLFISYLLFDADYRITGDSVFITGIAAAIAWQLVGYHKDSKKRKSG